MLNGHPEFLLSVNPHYDEAGVHAYGLFDVQISKTFKYAVLRGEKITNSWVRADCSRDRFTALSKRGESLFKDFKAFRLQSLRAWSLAQARVMVL
jgi:hypothetical protein